MYLAKISIPYDTYPELKQVFVGDILKTALFLSLVDSESSTMASIKIGEITSALIEDEQVVLHCVLQNSEFQMVKPDFINGKIVPFIRKDEENLNHLILDKIVIFNLINEGEKYNEL